MTAADDAGVCLKQQELKIAALLVWHCFFLYICLYKRRASVELERIKDKHCIIDCTSQTEA